MDELKQHMDAPDRLAQLDAMADRMGMDVDQIRALRAERPAVVTAEQPGFWPAAYGVRMRFASWLQQNVGFDAERSGPYVVSVDGFSAFGLKKVLTHLEPIPETAETEEERMIHRIGFITNGGAKKMSGTSYRAIDVLRNEIHIPATEGIQGLKTVLQASRSETAAKFARVLQRPENIKYAKRVIQTSAPEDEVEAYYEKLGTIQDVLSAYDLDRADAGLGHFLDTMGQTDGDHIEGESQSWAEYWTGVNSALFKQNIRSMDPLLGTLVLAIRDPKQYATWLTDETVEQLKELRTSASSAGNDAQVREIDTELAELSASGLSVSLVGIIDQETKKYRAVRYDPQSSSFVVGKTNPTPISWEQIRELAEKGNATPAYVPKYLLRAAADMYIATDHKDAEEVLMNEEILCGIYRKHTEQSYPSIHCPPCGPDEEPVSAYSYLEWYNPNGENGHRLERTLSRFQAGIQSVLR